MAERDSSASPAVIDLGPATQRMAGLTTSVDDDQLGLPTPCPEMTVGDLIDHIGTFANRFIASAHKNTGDRTQSPPPPSATKLEDGWRDRIPHRGRAPDREDPHG